MKAKSFDKKMILNKNTVINLTSEEMKVQHGGIITQQITRCVTYCYCPQTWINC